MTPPQLTADTPVLNITHPRHIHIGVLLWHKFNVAILHRLDSRLGKWGDFDIPLVGQKWLNHHARAVAFGSF